MNILKIPSARLMILSVIIVFIGLYVFKDGSLGVLLRSGGWVAFCITAGIGAYKFTLLKSKKVRKKT
tara:strand:+ start:25605 stop:25805 length:201 start_codon:yes stop_codon:yes gene_type:complete